MKSFTGLNIFKDHIRLNPELPSHWRRVFYRMQQRGNWFAVEVTPEKLSVTREKKSEFDVELEAQERMYSFDGKGRTVEIGFPESRNRLPSTENLEIQTE